jgi:hypothetical protein
MNSATPRPIAAGTSSPRLRQRHDSFTLVEVLVSMAIFSIMLIAIASMLNYVAAGWLAGVNNADNFTTARTLLTVLDRDVQRMAMRRDLAAFADQTNGPAFAFYTADQGYTPTASSNTRSLSIVKYALVTTTTNSILQRLNYGMDYTLGSAPTTPAIGYTTNLVALTNSTFVANSPENIASGVIAFQWQFIDGSGTILTPPYYLTSQPPYSSANFPPSYTSANLPPSGPTPFWFDYIYPNASYNPKMLVVSVAVVSDPTSAFLQNNSTYLPTLVADFPTTLPSGQTNQTYAQYWNGQLNSSTFGAGMPLPLRTAGAIKVFERHIPLPIGL